MRIKYSGCTRSAERLTFFARRVSLPSADVTASLTQPYTMPHRHAPPAGAPAVLLLLLLAAPAARSDPPSPAAMALQAALDAAISAGDHSFALPGGPILFNGANFNVSSAYAISIGGAATTTLFFEPGFGVLVSDTRSTTLHDFSIDYSPLPFVFGPVRAGGNRSGFVVDLEAASLLFEDLVARYPPHDTWPGAGFFRGGELLRAACSWGSPTPAAPVAGSPRAYSVRCDGSGTAAGDVFVAATRVGITLSLSRCAAVTVRDVNILSAGYMALTEFQGDGGNVYERVRVSPPSPARPLGSNADGFHSSGAAAGPSLLNTTIRNLFDDFFNVHTTAQLYIGPSWDGATTFLVGD